MCKYTNKRTNNAVFAITRENRERQKKKYLTADSVLKLLLNDAEEGFPVCDILGARSTFKTMYNNLLGRMYNGS